MKVLKEGMKEGRGSRDKRGVRRIGNGRDPSVE